MTDDATAAWGPIAGLIGTWEGGSGLDVAYSNAEGALADTPYRERTTFNPFGPVDNGSQALFGLDYRTSAWRGDEQNPFHTEVGYWLWDAAEGQVMRCFMVPRGSTILAGGTAAAEDTSFTLEATVGSETYGILSNRFLATHARAIRYSVTVTLGEGTYTYEETTTIEHARVPGGVLEHTDRNSMRRVEG
jgi:hypothetical protein